MKLYIDIPIFVSDIQFIGDWGEGTDEATGLANLSGPSGFVETQQRQVDGVTRYYYVTRPPRRCIIVTHGQPLPAFHGSVVDASVGWDDGHEGFVLPGNEGKKHSKITIRRSIPHATPEDADDTLSSLIARAPRSDRPGGARGHVGRKPIGSTSDPLRYKQLTMPESYWQRLLKLGGGGKNYSAALRNLIDKMSTDH